MRIVEQDGGVDGVSWRVSCFLARQENNLGYGVATPLGEPQRNSDDVLALISSREIKVREDQLIRSSLISHLKQSSFIMQW